MPAWSTAREGLGLQEVVNNKDLWKTLLAEFVGTLFLVFIGCLTCIGWTDEGYAPSIVQIALGFGITVATMAQVSGQSSGSAGRGQGTAEVSGQMSEVSDWWCMYGRCLKGQRAW